MTVALTPHEQDVADAFARARETMTPIAAPEIAGGVEAGYRIQRLNRERALAGGARIVGRKIGLTSAAVQAQLGVTEPNFGFLYASGDKTGAGALPRRAFMQPRIEAEIAFIMARDLPATLTPEDAPAYIAAVAAAAEIVDSAIQDWRITGPALIADNGAASCFALGATRPFPAGWKPSEARMRMTGGETDSAGSGAAAMGDPLRALCWLAEAATRYGAPVKAGEIVLSGALGPMVWVRGGERFEIAVEGLDDLAVAFAPD